jgi:chromosome segregation ATPase
VDHPLVVAGHVGVVGVLAEAERLLPERRQQGRVVTVDGDVAES